MAVDPEFVTTLSADIQGIFWPQAAKYTASEIEEQFREAVQDGQLMGNEGFVTNLMFIVRKREVVALREDVFKEYRVGRLPREARMSTLKTAYALGGRQEREAIDGWLAQTLRSEYESSNRLTGSRHLDVADRVGGGDTLDVMKDLLPQAVRAQQDAEAEPSPDFELIGQLDRVRSNLDDKIAILDRKLSVLALDEADRMTELAGLYLGRRRFFEAWAYKRLLAGPASDAIVGIRAALQRIGSVVATRGLPAEQQAAVRRDARLRGLCLLERLGARLTPAESQALDQHAELIDGNPGLYRREYDWGDVLDRS